MASSSSFNILNISSLPLETRDVWMARIMAMLVSNKVEPTALYEGLVAAYFAILKSRSLGEAEHRRFEDSDAIKELRNEEKNNTWLAMVETGKTKVVAVATLRDAGAITTVMNLITLHVDPQFKNADLDTRLCDKCLEITAASDKLSLVVDSLIDLPMLRFFARRGFVIVPKSNRTFIAVDFDNPETANVALKLLERRGTVTEQEKQLQDFLSAGGDMPKQEFEQVYKNCIDSTGCVPVLWMEKKLFTVATS